MVWRATTMSTPRGRCAQRVTHTASPTNPSDTSPARTASVDLLQLAAKGYMAGLPCSLSFTPSTHETGASMAAMPIAWQSPSGFCCVSLSGSARRVEPTACDRISRFHGQQNPRFRPPGADSLHEKFYWRTVTPIHHTSWHRPALDPPGSARGFRASCYPSRNADPRFTVDRRLGHRAQHGSGRGGRRGASRARSL
jgi:hypothetical protein